MERKLCFTLDDQNFTNLLVLKVTEAEELDEFTIKSFNDNNEIKKHYNKEINDFLDCFKNKHNNKANSTNGSIVLLEESDNKLIEKEILYKHCLQEIRLLLKDRQFILDLHEDSKSSFFVTKQNFSVADKVLDAARKQTYNDLTSFSNTWFDILKTKSDFYEIIRNLYVYAKIKHYPKLLLLHQGKNGSDKTLDPPIYNVTTKDQPYKGEFDFQGMTEEEIKMLQEDGLRCYNYRPTYIFDQEINPDILEKMEPKSSGDDRHVR